MGSMEDYNQIEFGTLAEQEDEAYYDERCDADDDLEKGRIKFPDKKLYGREKELLQLHDIFKSFENDFTSRIIFLGGYSGTGKSTLIDRFQTELRGNGKGNVGFLSGKYGQIKAGEPFSAISHALNQYVLQLTQDASTKEIQSLQRRLAKVRISAGSDDAIILKQTLVPSLDGLLQRDAPESAKSNQNAEVRGSFIHDISAIKFALKGFVKALADKSRPISICIDDLQWADAASLDLLKGVLSDKTLKCVIFIGMYRANEIDDDHELSKTMKHIEEARGTELTTRMEIFNLSPDSIAEFIADCIDRSPKEVDPVAEAVYTKTLGNIFFVKQAFEELVRKNALYYDMVMFQWQFGDVSRVELEKCLSDDVIEMVQSKLRTLPNSLQRALAVAAYTKNTIELDLLADLLSSKSMQMTTMRLDKMLNQAFIEGLILKSNPVGPRGKRGGKRTYLFAHDRIREAACASVPSGAERDRLLIRISKVLLQKGTPEKNDWMLFSAARHMNSVPSTMTNAIDMAALNLTVGKIANSKGAFNEAAVFLRAGSDRLDSSCWEDHYQLALDLKSTLMETENSIGCHEKALSLSDEICKKAHTLSEKTRAHFVCVDATSKSSEFSDAISKATEILKLYGLDIPSVTPTDGHLKREKFRLKIALRGRSLLCLAKFPVAKDDVLVAKMRLVQLLMRLANFEKQVNLAAMFGFRMLREGLAKKAITKDFPGVLVFLGGPLRKDEKYEAAFSYANAAIALMNRYPEETGLEYIKGKFTLYGSLSCLRLPFREAIETFLELNKLLLAKGENGMGLGAGMLGMYAFLNASLPLNSLLEPKLLLLEEMAVTLGIKSFRVVFCLLRQCLYNLQGGMKASPIPTELDGAAFNEAQVMDELEGNTARMTFRDISIIRLKLAVIFDNESVMDSMLDRLDEYPVYDLPVERQHIRMSYVGFAALMLNSQKHAKWAKTSLQFFEKLSRFGSPNAQPVYACMKALDKPSVEAFDDAIQICGNAGLFNLTALMNERCGLMLMNEDIKNPDKELCEDYLRNSIWLYHDWGATGKVSQMQSRFPFLREAMQEKVPSQLSSVRRKCAMLGVPRTATLSDLHSN